MNKLRMTGFECFTAFVIRRAKHIPEGTRPAISDKSYVSELDKIDEFPNRTSAAYFSFYLYRKYRYSFFNQQKFPTKKEATTSKSYHLIGALTRHFPHVILNLEKTLPDIRKESVSKIGIPFPYLDYYR